MKAILKRDYAASNLVTFGKLYLPWIKEIPDIYTLELKDGDNLSGSCIMSGIYTCIPHDSADHPNTWQLVNVPKRTEILIHPGNYASEVRIGELVHKSDTLGCILVGFGIDESMPMITRSQDAMAYLRTTIGVKTTFELEIQD